MDKVVEEGTVAGLDFTKLAQVAQAAPGVLPVVVQDAGTGEVLILAYANREALEHTLRHKVATFWSTSRNELWIKGATSGDYLDLVDVRVNCEQNSLLYRVTPRTSGACHTCGQDGAHRSTCYYRSIVADGSLRFVPGLE